MSVEEMPLLDRIDDINNPHSNFIEIFGINIKDVDAIRKKLIRMLRVYHTDKCSVSNGFDANVVENCAKISKKLTEIIAKLDSDGNLDFLTPKPSQIISIENSLINVTAVSDTKQQRIFYTNLLNTPKILELARHILTALKEKYPDIDSKKINIFFTNVLESVAKNITLSFFDDNYDTGSLQTQILAFIEKSELANGKYKLHDIIDFLGNDRENLGNDYCVALNIFYNLMKKVFGFFSVESAPTFGFSSFYKHQDRCIDNTSYSPQPKKGSALTFKTTRSIIDTQTSKFKKLQDELNLAVLQDENPIFIPDFVEGEEGNVNVSEGEGGFKSRRRHRRKPARKTRRGRGRKSKSKSKSKTHRRRRHSRIRKHKKNTYTRRR